MGAATRRRGSGTLLGRDLWPVLPPVLLVLAGLAVLASGRWLAGLLVVGGAVVLAGLLRALLPSSRAGLLAVRGRAFDAVALCALGAMIITVALLR